MVGKKNNETEPLSPELRQLAAIAYGESSVENVENEMFAIASVMVRQRDARRHRDIPTFVAKEKTYSFVVRDGSQRYRKFMNVSKEEINSDSGMSMALAAARNALAGGEDRSNGAFFWDGVDIQTNYKNHFKVRCGIVFTDPGHNIYKIEESLRPRTVTVEVKKTNKKTGKVSISLEELGRIDHAYDSTAAFGGTIFWKYNPHYLKVTRGKEHL